MALRTLQTLKLDKLLDAEVMLSTSRPIEVSFSAIAFVFDEVFKCFFNQLRVMFIWTTLYNLMEHHLH